MKTRFTALTLLVFLCLFSFGVALAQDNPTTGTIYLQSATFDPLQSADSATNQQSNIAAAEVDGSASRYSIVQFSGPVQAQWLQQVAALGGEVIGYVPENAHIVRASAKVLADVASLPSVRWIGPYRPNYKLSPALANQVSAADGDAAAFQDLYVVAFPGESLDALRRSLVLLGANVTEAFEGPLGAVVRASLPVSAVAQVVQNPAVSWLEPYLPMETTNAQARKILNAENVWQDFGYYGQGQIIAVSDSGLSVQGNLSADFAGRLIKAYAPSEMNLASPQCSAKTTFTDLHGHGTHVSGSILGNGTQSGSNAGNHQYASSNAGVAPEAQLVFMALNTDGSSGIQCIDTNGDFLARGYQNGARISSNSWGASDNGGYNIIASLVDNYIWNHKDYLVLYAAGNAGPDSQTIGSPGTAKNVLTVGASENNRSDKGSRGDNVNEIADFSSRGPTDDGRLKPDVVAPGTWILSVRAAQAPDGSFWDNFDNNYAFMGGTSMATPLTAGSAALVREWLAKQRGITDPSSALMKAVMINGAVQLPGASVADMNSGYGRVDLKNTLRANYLTMDDYVQGISTGQSVSYTIQVVANLQQGVVIASAGLPEASTVQAADVSTLHLVDSHSAVSASQLKSDRSGFTVEPLPGYQKAHNPSPIPTGNSKSGNSLLSGQQRALPHRTAKNGSSHFKPRPAGAAQTQSSLYQYIGGGDFEDPDWTDYWQYVWLGGGIPVRTSNPNLVITGEYSMWLGGTESQDSIWYPVHFPDQIDTANKSTLQFNIDLYDQDDKDDYTCVALVDDSGYFIGPFAPDQPLCENVSDKYTFSYDFSSSELQALAGQSGYLVLYTVSDGLEPHQSAIVDDIYMTIDFPDVELSVAPASGPPGTTFLLVGHYNFPYSAIDICISPCNNDNYIKTVYADSAGNMAAFLYSSTTIDPGQYPIETLDFASRAGHTTLTIGDGGVSASLSVDPTSGPAGTDFNFTGAGFVPNDSAINVTVNGNALGTVGSDDNGQISFHIQTNSNTTAGEYTVEATDSANHNASTQMNVTAVAEQDPALSVSPASGPAGTTFTFQASHFTPSTAVEVRLDNQLIGNATTDENGNLQLNVDTTAATTPGQYTLSLVQGDKQASAQYTVTGGGGGGPAASGGLNITLVWTDPPAQTAASKRLVNDLDLSVQGPGGLVYAGGADAPDHVNNVEVIRLSNPTAGNYQITVSASSVNGQFGAQPFALVASSDSTGAATNNVALTGGNLTAGSKKTFLPLVQR
ncbi:MAG: S8 family serine peptidase [Caldilineaceae bacterium]